VAAMDTTDGDRDGKLTQQEIQERLQIYVDSQTAIANFQIGFLRGNKEADDLEVTVVPEPFLQEYIEPAKGETNLAGVVTPCIEFSEPEIAAQGYGGLRLGMYRVQIKSLDGDAIPKKYADETTLGVEVGLEHHAPLPTFKLSY